MKLFADNGVFVSGDESLIVRSTKWHSCTTQLRTEGSFSVPVSLKYRLVICDSCTHHFHYTAQGLQQLSQHGKEKSQSRFVCK